MEIGRRWVKILQRKPAELSLWAQNCLVCGASGRSPWACDCTHVLHGVICTDHIVSGNRKQHNYKQFHAIPTRKSSQGKGSCWFPKCSMVSPAWANVTFNYTHHWKTWLYTVGIHLCFSSSSEGNIETYLAARVFSCEYSSIYHSVYWQ